MHIQPTLNVPLTQNAAGVTMGNSSQGEKPTEELRVDWSVRMNVRHSSGFVGGAGRVLIHNLGGEDRREVVMFLPAAMADRPGRLELASATICSARPGLQAMPGQTLVYRTEGAKAIVTIPVLKPNDWVYIDLTWTGAFPQGGLAFPGGQIPLGEFHPQLATEITMDDGRQGLGPVPARYEVELGSDLGAVVRQDSEEFGRVVSRTGDDGETTIHEFKSYGKAHIQAFLAPPGAITGPSVSVASAYAEQQQPAGNVPALGSDAPQRGVIGRDAPTHVI